MGAPTSEVGYTSSTTRRVADHLYGHVVALGKNYIIAQLCLKLAISIFFFIEFLLKHDREWPKYVGLPHLLLWLIMVPLLLYK
jgi:hypothetical protein